MSNANAATEAPDEIPEHNTPHPFEPPDDGEHGIQLDEDETSRPGDVVEGDVEITADEFTVELTLRGRPEEVVRTVRMLANL